MIKEIIIKIKPLFRAIKYIQRRKRGVVEDSQGVSRNELDALLDVAGETKIIIEIGCAFGHTTKRLALNNMVIAVDPFLPDEDKLLMGRYPEDIFKEFFQNIQNFPVLFFPMTSENAFLLWDLIIKRKVDGIFIDGKHTYEAVKQDSKWIKYVKKGGFIAFHDVKHSNEIIYFIEDIIVPRFKLIKKVNNLWIFRK